MYSTTSQLASLRKRAHKSWIRICVMIDCTQKRRRRALLPACLWSHTQHTSSCGLTDGARHAMVRKHLQQPVPPPSPLWPLSKFLYIFHVLFVSQNDIFPDFPKNIVYWNATTVSVPDMCPLLNFKILEMYSLFFLFFLQNKKRKLKLQ